MKALVATLILFSTTSTTFAHEGHSHESLSAPHGGSVYEGKNLGVELVQDGKKLSLYPVDRNWKLFSAADFQKTEMTAQLTLRNKKVENLTLKRESDHFSAEFDTKGEARAKITLSLSTKGTKETINFNVEPQ